MTCPVYAEDIEIYGGNAPPSEPNVLFVTDFSSSMRRPFKDSPLSRIESLRKAFKKVTSNESLKANMSILGFSGKRASAKGGGGEYFPVR